MPDFTPVPVPQEIANDDTVRIVTLPVAEGTHIKAGDRLAEIETSKSSMEITSPVDGWVELKCKCGEDVPVGEAIARVHESQSAYLSAVKPTVKSTAPAASEAHTTVFSLAAQLETEKNGLDPAKFKYLAFVRKQDIEAAISNAQTDEQTPTGSQEIVELNPPLQQTFGDEMTFLELLRADAYRINGRDDFGELFRQWRTNPAFQYLIWFRMAQAARKSPLLKFFVYPVAVWRMVQCHYQSGIRIPLSVKAGPGLLIGHWGGIWINPNCTFGSNCSLNNDINMGEAGGSGLRGVPQLGDNVYIGPGARLAGAITLYQESSVMANTVVTSDLPPGAIALGVPHKITGHQKINRFVSNRWNSNISKME
ncbi:biotin/lipoyl-containing protein [Prosthecobacter sp. SYSU 5D2]|uniref:biotin/lipoyl-containing protein n=1 Tax=Prosthecobacter sp. SYSU 5D2 TaxID=3134134 RepID=UPI0031FEB498